jgi:polyprenyl P-hydroxybenzoate/phenylacrylic acid decarboxylase-like protein
MKSGNVQKKRIVVGISGSSCSILGIRMLQALRQAGIETHLVMSGFAEKVIEHETGMKPEAVRKLADFSYERKDFFAPIASGSFRTEGMIVIPCSMKTLAGIASGYSNNLLLRAADVMLKERRNLVLVARETPLSLIHIRNMETATIAGAVILPPVLTCYSKPSGIDDMVSHIIGKALDQFGIDSGYRRWKEGSMKSAAGKKKVGST